jgi:hypothetical protein
MVSRSGTGGASLRTSLWVLLALIPLRFDLLAVFILRPFWVLVRSGLAVAVLCGHTAFAQAPLPNEVLQASPLSSVDQNTVKQYVQQAVDDLLSSDSAKAQDARDALVKPVLKETSIGFRLYYSDLALPKLAALFAPGADAQRAQLAMTVAGAIATDAAADRLHKALGDPRAAVRFGAARELGVLLGQVDKGKAAMQADRARTTVSILAMALTGEKNIFVASELAKALAVPVNTEALQDAALTALCDGMADQASSRQARAANSDDAVEEIIVFLRAISSAQESLIKRQISGNPSPNLNVAAGRLAAESQKYADEAMANRKLDGEGRTLVDRLQNAAENLRDLATGLGN